MRLSEMEGGRKVKYLRISLWTTVNLRMFPHLCYNSMPINDVTVCQERVKAKFVSRSRNLNLNVIVHMISYDIANIRSHTSITK